MAKSKWITNKKELRGRPNKFDPGDVVEVNGRLHAVVDWKSKESNSYYACVPINEITQADKAAARWYMSTDVHTAVTKTGRRTAPTVLRRYRRWRRFDPEGKGCGCMCCTHIPLAPSEVNLDGTFAWEGDEE